MIVNSKEILREAYKNKYAIPHFNINNLESTRYILEECEACKSPVIIGVSESAARYMGGYVTVATMIKNLHNFLNISVPVVIHLDHGSSVEECIKAIIAGFTSVMYDGSKLTIDENIKNLKTLIEYAEKFDISIEGEVGVISKTSDNNLDLIAYSNVEECIKLCKDAKIDALAPSIGNKHGLYKGTPNINLDLLSIINTKLNIPLVLHGGSFIPNDIIEKLIDLGICKININTELQYKWALGVKEYLNGNKEEIDPRKIISSGEKLMKDEIRNKINLFKSFNKS